MKCFLYICTRKPITFNVMKQNEDINRLFCYFAIVNIFQDIDDWVTMCKYKPKVVKRALKLYNVQIGQEPGVIFYNDYFAIVYHSRKKKYFVHSLKCDFPDFIPDDFLTELFRSFDF